MTPIWMAFLVGGLLCLVGQLVMDLTPYQVTPGHVLVGYVTLGAGASALGFYEPLVNIGGAGATVPLSGFGHLLAQGAMAGAKQDGLLGALSGGVATAAVGVAAAVVFGFVMATLFNPRG